MPVGSYHEAMSTFQGAGAAMFGRTGQAGLGVLGVGAAIVGILLLGWPDKTEQVVGNLFGVYLLLSAATLLVAVFGSDMGRTPKVLLTLAAVICAAAAVLCFGSGNWVLLLAMWIGLAWAVRGIIHAIAAVWEDQDRTGRGRQEWFGLLMLVIGLAIAIIPFGSAASLAIAAGLAMIVFGALELVTAVADSRREQPAAMPWSAAGVPERWSGSSQLPR